MAPSSRAVATFIPLLMADWVWFNWPWVADRYCSATNAPPLVLTLKVIRSLRSGFCSSGVLPVSLKGKRRAGLRQDVVRHRFWAERENRDRREFALRA